MRNIPLNVILEGKPCLLIGSELAGLNKARLLAKGGAILNVLTTTEVAPELLELIESGGGSLSHFKSYSELHCFLQDSALLESAALCVCALSDEASLQQIVQLCRQKRLLCNVVDKPELCDMTFPSIVDRGSLKVAVSTSGQAPVLARMLRQQLEAIIPFAMEPLNDLAAEFRLQVQREVKSSEQRSRFWQQVFDGPIADLVSKGKIDQAREALVASMERGVAESPGEVYLVGAGPGDPELLTLKALRLMQSADIVFYDRLVSKPVLELVRRDAERYYVGKQQANHSTSQEGINDLLLRHAEEGKRVLRLKGGDPFIFGRGGEEIEHLAQHKVAFQVVPGITAATGCASYAGIPLTHRDHAQSVRFVTGHLKQGSPALPWQEFVDPNQTLVFYMSLVGLAQVCENMIAHGRDAETPAALIQQGTLSTQRVVTGTLFTLPQLAVEYKIQAPTITIVGSVVQLREKLTWFGESDQVE